MVASLQLIGSLLASSYSLLVASFQLAGDQLASSRLVGGYLAVNKLFWRILSLC